jgi:hypothetical protein
MTKIYAKASKLFYSWTMATIIGIIAGVFLAFQGTNVVVAIIFGLLVGYAMNLLGIVYKGVFYQGQFGVDLSINYETGEIVKGKQSGNLKNLAKFSVISIRRYGQQINLVFKDDSSIRAFSKDAALAEQDLIKFANDKQLVAETKNKILPGQGTEYILN